jgi:predicted MPP superfamily phosphohydrolase
MADLDNRCAIADDTMSRRTFLRGGVFGVSALASLTFYETYAARYVNPYQPQLEQVSIPLPPGHDVLAGLRIGFVTDTHAGPFIGAEDVARATSLLAAQRPDLILFGGDYASESSRYLAAVVDAFAALAGAAPLGAYAVLGNHDFTVGRRRVAEALTDAGIPLLRNELAPVAFGGDELWIAGIDETLVGDPRPVETLGRAPEGAAKLALWHEPQFAEITASRGAFAQLSGHTHGGQVRLPGIGPVGLPVHGKRYVIGLNHAAGMPIYTSRGVGVYRPPVRFNCPPEVTLITLVSPENGVAEPV